MQEAGQLPGVKYCTAEGKEYQGEHCENDKGVHQVGKYNTVANQRQRNTEGPKHQVEEAKLDDNKTPESEEMRDARERITQHTALTKYDQEKFTDTVIDVVG